MGAGFVPVRKKGKLPYETVEESYALEYGTDTLQMHKDGLISGHKVLVVDDLLATGGTVGAVTRLCKKLGAEVVEAAFLIELEFLKGREKLDGTKVFSLIRY
jgi:adenine phosphoribosyltransferase